MMYLDNAWSTTNFTKESMERTPLQLGYFMNVPVLGIGVKSYIAGTNLIIRHLQIRELAVESQRWLF